MYQIGNVYKRKDPYESLETDATRRNTTTFTSLLSLYPGMQSQTPLRRLLKERNQNIVFTPFTAGELSNSPRFILLVFATGFESTRGCPFREDFAHSVSHPLLVVRNALTGTRSAGSEDFAHSGTTGRLSSQSLLSALKARPLPAVLYRSCVSAGK